MTDSSDAYDDVLYESFSYPQSHPDRLATIATLFGLKPRLLDAAARVLEIGCASGGNLLPMAAAYPESEFIGIDLSSRHIAKAQAGVDALKLGNVQLKTMDLAQFDEQAFGSFDYIIAHGVYSWVAAPIREKLMALCASRLRPMGVVYLSYNTLPGSSARGVLRAMARFHTRRFKKDLAEQVSKARSLFAFLDLALKERSDPANQSMQEELSAAAGLQDFYIAHEYLETTNDPCYFHEFVAHAQRHGLQFLAEAEIQTMSGSHYSPSVRAGLREMATSVVEAEQYGDFVKNRAFRQTLLCHAATTLKHSISPERIRDFHIAFSAELFGEMGELRTNFRIQFRDADGVILQVTDPLTKAALLELRAVWPLSMKFDALLNKAAACAGVPVDDQSAATLSNSLLTCYSTSRAIELHVSPSKFHASVSEFPTATAFSRWQAGCGSRITNLRHENIILGVTENALLQKLDGTHSRSSLEATFPEARTILDRFAGAALLIS